MSGYCLAPGEHYKGETPPNPILTYMGICGDLPLLFHTTPEHKRNKLATSILRRYGKEEQTALDVSATIHEAEEGNEGAKFMACACAVVSG